jgi:hypothetical protein
MFYFIREVRDHGYGEHGFQQAYVNGQPIRFEETSPPTVTDLREHGHIRAHQTVAKEHRNGAVEGLPDDERIKAGESFVTIPRFIWG